MKCVMTDEDHPETCRPYGCFTICTYNLRPNEAIEDLQSFTEKETPE